MHSNSTEVSPWERVERTAREIFDIVENLPAGGMPFVVTEYIPGIHIRFECVCPRTHTALQYYLPDNSDEREYALMTADEHAVWLMRQNKITRCENHPYPLIECDWVSDAHDDTKGNLVRFRYDLSSSVFATYALENNYRKECTCDKSGAHLSVLEASELLPSSLQGVTHIRKKQVPHLINYREKAEYIEARSRIHEFLAACRESANA